MDRAIARLVPAVSRGEARRLIEAGVVFVNRRRTRLCGKPVEADARLVAFRPATLDMTVSSPQIVATSGTSDGWVLIDKPVGMPVEPTRQGVAGTLMSWCKEHVQGPVFVAHRLDAATSGLILLARSKAALAELNKAFAARLIDRTYLAVVARAPAWDTQTLDGPLDEKPAVTHARVLARNQRAALLELTLETGRTNQIRRHLSDAGHPVVGDRAFGGPPAARLLLHATKLAWESWPAERSRSFERAPGRDFVEGAANLSLALPGH